MQKYLEPLIGLFRQGADNMKAKQMERYMKNRFPFLGLNRPDRSNLQKEFFRHYGLPAIEKLPPLIAELWELSEREFQYFGMDLLVKMVKKLPAESIEIFQKMIVEKSWWDTVDLIAGKLISIHFGRFPKVKEHYLADWRKSDNIWLRRTCLLFQLHYKENTDVDLLFALIRENLGSKEFFINKAIGWALREYSKTDVEAVIDFVDDTDLHPLSCREALKWLKEEGKG